MTEIIKQLRQITGAGVLDCQEALKESNDDLDKAIEFLRKRDKNLPTTKGREPLMRE